MAPRGMKKQLVRVLLLDSMQVLSYGVIIVLGFESQGQPELILRRDEALTGVLIDDLI